MSDSDCTLSPQARAFSSIISAFVGSIVNGLTSGYLIAFVTGWITWFAFFRVVISGLYMLFRSATGTWVPEQNIETYNLVDRASPDPEAGPVYPRQDSADSSNSGQDPFLQYPKSGSFATTSAQANPSNEPLISGASTDDYHRHVYNTVFGNETAPNIARPGLLKTFWPTRADIAIRHQNALYAQQKCSELRRFYPSDRELHSAIRRYVLMHKMGALPGPSPLILNSWQPLNREVTFLGWFGWTYTAVYAPISQIIWLASNVAVDNSSGFAKIVKGIAVGVTALPLCLDNKVRYAESLQTKRFGGCWAYYAFNLTNAISCLFQGIVCGALLVWGVIEARNNTDPFFVASFPWPIVAIYPIFSLIWAFGSFQLVPMRDGGRKRAAQSHWLGYILDVGVGAFAGLFVAAPAFALYFSQSDPADGGTFSEGVSGLNEFLSCDVPGWQKFSAIFP